MVEVTKTNVDLWLSAGGTLGEEHIESLEKFTNENPFYGPTHALLAKAYFNTQNQNFEKQLKKAALCTNDRLWLYNFIHQAKVEPVNLKKPVEIKREEKKVLVKLDKKEPAPKAKKEKKEVSKSPKKKSPVKKEAKSTVVKKTAGKKKTVQKKTKKSPRIKIEQGDGDVIADLKEETIHSQAPKLQVERTMEQKEVLPTNLPKESFNTKSHSFLDWLDYSTFDQSDTTKNPEIEDVKENNVEKTVGLLEKFIANKPKPGEIKLEAYNPEEKSLESDSEELIPVSETLADVLIAQNELEKAEEVYQKLMLKFPQKSTYFAALIQKLNNK